MYLVPVPLCPTLKDEHGNNEGCGAKRHRDGPHTIAPSPGRVLEDTVRHDRTEIKGGNGGDRLGQGRPETSIQEASGICNEYLLHYSIAGVADGLEDAAHLKDDELLAWQLSVQDRKIPSKGLTI